MASHLRLLCCMFGLLAVQELPRAVGVTFSLDPVETKVDGQATCGVLHCWEEVKPGSASITSISSLTVYKQEAGRRVTLTTLSQEKPIDNGTFDGIEVEGMWTPEKAEVNLSLVEKDDCTQVQFFCQVRYTDGQGRERMRSAVVDGEGATTHEQTEDTPSSESDGKTSVMSGGVLSSTDGTRLVAIEEQLNTKVGVSEKFLVGGASHVQKRAEGTKLTALKDDTVSDAETLKEVSKTILETVRTAMTFLTKDMNIVKEDVRSVKVEVKSINEEVKSINEKVNSIKEEVKSVKENMDKEINSVKKTMEEKIKSAEEVSKTILETIRTATTFLTKDFESVKEEVKSIKETMKEDVKSVKEEVKSIKETIKEDVKSVKEEVKSIKETRKEDVKSVKEEVKSVKGEVKSVKEDVKSVHETLGEEVKSVKEEVKSINETMGEEVKSVKETIKEEVKSVNETMGKEIKSIQETMGEEVKSVNETMEEEIKAIKETIKEEVKSVKDDAKSVEGTMKEEIESVKWTVRSDRWIVIQRRSRGDVSFYRNWDSYKNGFGSPDGDFWLGNKRIHALTSVRKYELYITLKFRHKYYYANYDRFSISGEKDNYRLHIGNYKGNAGDSLRSHNKMMFTTFDRDNDVLKSGNCAVEFPAGWWHHDCHQVNLNGIWGARKDKGPRWEHLTGTDPATFTEMKIREIIR